MTPGEVAYRRMAAGAYSREGVRGVVLLYVDTVMEKPSASRTEAMQTILTWGRQALRGEEAARWRGALEALSYVFANFVVDVPPLEE